MQNREKCSSLASGVARNLKGGIKLQKHQKSPVYFSQFSNTFNLFFLKGKVKREGAWHNAPLNTPLSLAHEFAPRQAF